MENDTERLTPQEEEAEQVRQRSKEGLIEKQGWLRDPGRVDLIQKRRFAHAFLEGNEDLGRTLVAQLTSFTWKEVFIRNFDLKLVSEQGAMLCEGSVPMRACGPAAVFRWTAGEMFVDVATRGAAMVRDAVKEHLAPKGHREIPGTRTTRWVFGDDGGTLRVPSRETCGACGDCFIPSTFGATKYTDGSGQVVSICERCLPQMTPDYKIINGRLVKTLPMPDEIRRGMAFYSDTWRLPNAPHGVLVADGPSSGIRCGGEVGWESTEGLGFFASTGHFLGCDPAHASPEDCARYGIAPGFEVKQ